MNYDLKLDQSEAVSLRNALMTHLKSSVVMGDTGPNTQLLKKVYDRLERQLNTRHVSVTVLSCKPRDTDDNGTD